MANLASRGAAHYELSRDIYGFAIRPQHLTLYKQFAEIYKEEEAERSARWEEFLTTYGDSAKSTDSAGSVVAHDVLGCTATEDGLKKEKGGRKPEMWCEISPILEPVEKALQHRFKKKKTTATDLATAVESYGASSPSRYLFQGSEDDSDEEFYDAERVDTVQDGSRSMSEVLNDASNHGEESCLWKEELDALVRGGVPMALRGEVWQVFMGSSPRRVHGHYQALLTVLPDGGGDGNGLEGLCNQNYKLPSTPILEKWTKQIEKDLPRTFPGHPALGVDGRNALRHLLTAYARHNPNVGYCQAMNFFGGLLLLMMPEENAFWTLTGILDDCFEGYYSEQMLECQVDQLVLEELVRDHFPRLSNHLDTLGVQAGWISGPWFLSIFVSVLPWESVLRVWDVLLYEGNRSMLFRTTLALLELYGSTIMTAKDAGDAMTMVQSLASATFDSSQLVLTACVGYQFVTESQLQQLRQKHRPRVLAMFSERLAWHKGYGPNSFSSNTCEYDKTKNAIRDQKFSSGENLDDTDDADAFLENCEEYTRSMKKEAVCGPNDIAEDGVLDKGTMLADLVSQVSCMKLKLSRALEDRRVANLRAEELETAFMELVKRDNRRLLSAKVETVEAEVAYLKRTLADKVEQDQAMIQVMVRMEHEQKITENARQLAEEDAKTQRSALNAIQVKYEGVISSLKELERRTANAESMLEATTQYQDVCNSQIAPSKLPSASAPGEEPSRWAWSWNTSKSTDNDNLSSATHGTDSNDEMKGNGADPPQSHGLLSRTFSTGWREKLKGKISSDDMSN